jgi:hypothetical protein
MLNDVPTIDDGVVFVSLLGFLTIIFPFSVEERGKVRGGHSRRNILEIDIFSEGKGPFEENLHFRDKRCCQYRRTK